MSATTSTDVFSKMLKIQAIAMVSLAIFVFAIFGTHAGISVLVGGLSVILGAYVAALISKKSLGAQDATAVLVNLLKAEAIKICIIIGLLFVAFKFYAQLVPFALIAGLAITALFSAAALSKLNV